MSKQKMYRGEALDGKRVIIGWYRERHWVAGGKEYCSYTIYDGERRQEVEVHPDSVSQSTGRFDKNDVEIFGMMKVKHINTMVYCVEWDDNKLMYRLQRIDGTYYDCLHWDTDLEVIPEGSEE